MIKTRLGNSEVAFIAIRKNGKVDAEKFDNDQVFTNVDPFRCFVADGGYAEIEAAIKALEAKQDIKPHAPKQGKWFKYL